MNTVCQEMDVPLIRFDKDDLLRVQTPHEDPLVISLIVSNCLSKRVLVDPGNNANIINKVAFEQLIVEPKQVKPTGNPLVGFDGKRVEPIRIVELPVYAARRNLKENFVIVDEHLSQPPDGKRTNSSIYSEESDALQKKSIALQASSKEASNIKELVNLCLMTDKDKLKYSIFLCFNDVRLLPKEVLTEILSRLPAKSLLRFRCVSKSWLSLITSPNFIAIHLNQSHTNNSHLLIKYYSLNPKKERFSLRVDDNDKSFFELKCPFKTRNNSFFRMVGICNGLICLSDDHFGYTYTIIIWNPAIRKCVNLPKPRVCFHTYGPYMFALGFGFDSRTNDYKVVRIAYLQHRMGSWDTSAGVESLLFGGGEGYIFPPEVEVFALKTGSWKTIEANVPPYNMVEYFWSSAFVNGTIHWLVYGKWEGSNQNHRGTIIGFDVGGEVFCELNLPKKLADDNPLNLAIAVFGDTLSVFQYDKRVKIEHCSVWVMKQYGVVESWSKQFNVDLHGGALGGALGFRRNGKILLARRNGKVISYDPDNRGSKSLGICGGTDSIYVGTYAESLALLDGVNAASGGAKVDSCDMVDSEEEPVSNGPDKDALEKHSFTHLLFSSVFLRQ
ncbi:F-box/kelch-repeat protein At3g06240-like [Cornus florida]|uniref:F-box/kelch-repeat protein At3g06240-like n=1 Tax=Cornus florida TaxID=4283 RepID=UPI002898C9F1|nr:F-box/kelch-repeat protein At3g06240-like [Cornus florida]